MIYDDLKGKKVLVTGSSSGIGAATAQMFAQQGCFVGVHYFRTQQGGENTFAQVQKLSSGCLLKADMRDKAQVFKMIKDFEKAAGQIDILVNNAGSLIARQTFADATEEYFDDVFATNVKSTFLATQAALEGLKKTKGCIINIGSIAGHTAGSVGGGIYASAKAAIATMTIAMAKEFAPFGIRVNSVLPGLIETRFHEQFSTPERRAQVALQTPLARNGNAEDVAKAILFLASKASGFITGEYIAVNGGLHMRA
ncbi:MAG: glucose 1-dehydrogenase [Phycisphaerales bacterium]